MVTVTVDRCNSCAHVEADHDERGQCTRQLVNPNDPKDPPDKVRCPRCTGWTPGVPS